jgi:hypothetical protein
MHFKVKMRPGCFGRQGLGVPPGSERRVTWPRSVAPGAP